MPGSLTDSHQQRRDVVVLAGAADEGVDRRKNRFERVVGGFAGKGRQRGQKPRLAKFRLPQRVRARDGTTEEKDVMRLLRHFFDSHAIQGLPMDDAQACEIGACFLRWLG